MSGNFVDLTELMHQRAELESRGRSDGAFRETISRQAEEIAFLKAKLEQCGELITKYYGAPRITAYKGDG